MRSRSIRLRQSERAVSLHTEREIPSRSVPETASDTEQLRECSASGYKLAQWMSCR